MTKFIVSLDQLQKLADELEPEPKETYKVKITLPEIVLCDDCVNYALDEFGRGWCNENCREAKPWDYCAWGECK